jgi:hypothetical protein
MCVNELFELVPGAVLTPLLLPVRWVHRCPLLGAFILAPVENQRYWRVAFFILAELVPSLADDFVVFMSDMAPGGRPLFSPSLSLMM